MKQLFESAFLYMLFLSPVLAQQSCSPGYTYCPTTGQCAAPGTQCPAAEIEVPLGPLSKGMYVLPGSGAFKCQEGYVLKPLPNSPNSWTCTPSKDESSSKDSSPPSK